MPIAGGAFVGEHSFSTNELPIGKGRPDNLDIYDIDKFAQKINEKIIDLDILKP